MSSPGSPLPASPSLRVSAMPSLPAFLRSSASVRNHSGPEHGWPAFFLKKKYHWPSPWSIGFFLIDHILFWPLNWMIIFVLLICRFELCSTTCICRIRELKASSSGNGSSMLAANSRHDWTKSATQKGSNIVPSLGFHGYLFHRHFPDSFRFSKVITNY